MTRREILPDDWRVVLLLIDNYDSFTYNLFQYLSELGEEVVVLRNDQTTIDEIERMSNFITPPEFEDESEIILNEINTFEPKLYVRGKFELWFFIEFIKSVIHILGKEMRERGMRLSIRTQLHLSNAIEILGPRSDIPTSLNSFLRSNLEIQRKGIFGLMSRLSDRVRLLKKAFELNISNF